MSTNLPPSDSGDTPNDFQTFSTEDLFNQEVSEESLVPDDPALIGRPIPCSEWGDIPLPDIDPDLNIPLATTDEAEFSQALASSKSPALEMSRAILRWIIARDGLLTLLPDGTAHFTFGAYRVELASEDAAPLVVVYRHETELIRTAW